MKQAGQMVHYVTHELPLLDNGTKMTAICGKVVAIGLMQYDGAVDFEKRVTLDSWWYKGDPTSTEVPVILYGRRAPR